MPTFISVTLGENLAETLDIGNYTTDGQKIRALNGSSSLNFRYSSDNEVVLTNDDINFLRAYVFMNLTALQAGFGQNFYIESTALASAFRVGGADSLISLNTSAIEHKDVSLDGISSVHALKIINNGSVDRTNVGADNAALFLNSGSGGNVSTIKQNVKRAICVGGEGLTAKTDNTLYCNKISFQDIGSLFDNIIGLGAIPTQDNLHILQDKSGTIAHISDTVQGGYIERWTVYTATLNATWETIIIADALPDSIIEITLECNSVAVRDMGVRAVGSVLNRQIIMVTRSASSLIVKTNALKQIQVYASNFADIIFIFSAQL